MHAQQLMSPAIGEMVLAPIELEDELPPLGILVRANATVISAGTEVANYLGRTTERPAERTDPYLPGYSFAGEVLAVGSEQERFVPGDRIAGPLPHASAAVEARPERLVRMTTIPVGVSDEEAALTQLGCIALNGVRRAAIELGDRVAVVGAGLVGLLAAQLALLDGAHPVVVLDLLSERRSAARALGFEHVLDPADPSTAQRLGELAPDGVDVVIEATGSPHAFVPALELARRDGRVVLLGSTRGDVPGFSPYDAAHKKGLTIVGAHVSTTPQHAGTRDRWTEAANRALLLDLMASGRLDARQLISDIVAPADAPQAFAELAAHPERHLGIAIDWRAARAGA